MAKEKVQIPFEDFIAMVAPETVPLVMQLDKLMRDGGREVGIQTAKSGYVVSYRHTSSGKVMANFVFRKKGIFIRLYADNIMKYMGVLDSLPADIKAQVAKAPLCTRLINPEKCSPHCPTRFESLQDGEPQQECRCNCVSLLVEVEPTPHRAAIVG